MIYNFDEKEIPYGTLERFGLTQEMIENLPTDVLQNILNGRHSPVLPVHIIADDGEEVKARTRFCLVRTPEGNVDVLFFPKLDEYDFKVFNEQQKQSLLAGKPIIGHLESNETGHELGNKARHPNQPSPAAPWRPATSARQRRPPRSPAPPRGRPRAPPRCCRSSRPRPWSA